MVVFVYLHGCVCVYVCRLWVCACVCVCLHGVYLWTATAAMSQFNGFVCCDHMVLLAELKGLLWFPWVSPRPCVG